MQYTALLALLLASAPALATLGGTADSPAVDSVHLHATLTLTPADSYSVQTLQLGDGGIVKEFLSAKGVVVAIAWHCPTRPDLQLLLGGYFGNAIKPGDSQAHDVRRGTDALWSARVHLDAAGNGNSGYAYLPRQLPGTLRPSRLR